MQNQVQWVALRGYCGILGNFNYSFVENIRQNKMIWEKLVMRIKKSSIFVEG